MNKKFFLISILIFVTSFLFGQKVNLIKEFKLEKCLIEIFGEPLIKKTSMFNTVYDFLCEVPTENGLSPVNPGFFIDDKNIGFAVNYNDLQIYIYNYEKNEWLKYFIHPDRKYKFILLEFLGINGCNFSAYNTESNERESLYFSFNENTYEVLADKNEFYKKKQKMKTEFNKNQKLSVIMIHEENDKILETCIESYYWTQSGSMGKCAVTDKKIGLSSFGEVGYEELYKNNYFQMLKGLNGKDILVSAYYPPVFSPDFTKLLCISNLSYNPEEIIDDDFTVYIYDIQY